MLPQSVANIAVMPYATGTAWCVLCPLTHQLGVGHDFSTLKVTKLTTTTTTTKNITR